MKLLCRWAARGAERRGPVDTEIVLASAILAAALVLGLCSGGDYGVSVDEFNTDDYGPKALAWYTSGFTDRSHFETVESPLWYYGPWFQMLTAFVQSFDLADRMNVRHVMTFVVGLAGIAAVLPIGRLAAGSWAGLTAILLCLITGYLYGNLFFAPIDVPFLAAMCWATLGIVIMTRRPLPSWRSTILTGFLIGLALGTRTGGIITYAYLAGALLLGALDVLGRSGRITARYVGSLAVRYGAVVAISSLVAIAIWPWLQIGNPFQQLKTALVHFTHVPLSFDFPHWGERVWTNQLPVSYIPMQLVARLPEGFLLLLGCAMLYGLATAVADLRMIAAVSRRSRHEAFRAVALALAHRRGILVVLAAVVMPLAFLIVQRTTMYDGIRHVLFVIPMLAVLAGSGMVGILPLLRWAPVLSGIAVGAYGGAAVAMLIALHPLQYVALNTLAGGVRAGEGKFEGDYWSMAATVALRRLERRLDYDATLANSKTPRILVCIGWREHMIAPMLQRPWIIETDPDEADFIIATERWRCAQDKPLTLIDEVRRLGRAFAWTYARRPN